MNERIVKVIKDRTNFPQHQTQQIQLIVDSEIGIEDITTPNKILNRIAINIISRLKEIGIVSESMNGIIYMDLLEAMGVYEIE